MKRNIRFISSLFLCAFALNYSIFAGCDSESYAKSNPEECAEEYRQSEDFEDNPCYDSAYASQNGEQCAEFFKSKDVGGTTGSSTPPGGTGNSDTTVTGGGSGSGSGSSSGGSSGSGSGSGSGSNGSGGSSGHDGNVTTNADGSTEVTNADGSTVKTYADGSTLVTKPDGTTVKTNADGSTVTTKADGTVIRTNADGSVAQTNGQSGDFNTVSGSGSSTGRIIYSGLNGLANLKVDSESNPQLKHLFETKWQKPVDYYLGYGMVRMPTELAADLAGLGITVDFTRTEEQIHAAGNYTGVISGASGSQGITDSGGTEDNNSGTSSDNNSNGGTSDTPYTDLSQCADEWYASENPDQCKDYTPGETSTGSTGGTTSSAGGTTNTTSSGGTGNTSGTSSNTGTAGNTQETATVKQKYNFSYARGIGHVKTVGARTSGFEAPPEEGQPVYTFGTSSGIGSMKTIGTRPSSGQGVVTAASGSASGTNHIKPPSDSTGGTGNSTEFSQNSIYSSGVTNYYARGYGSTADYIAISDVEIHGPTDGKSVYVVGLGDTAFGPIYTAMHEEQSFKDYFNKIKSGNSSNFKVIFADDETVPNGIAPRYDIDNKEMVLGLRGFPFNGSEFKKSGLSHILHEAVYSEFPEDMLELKGMYLGQDGIGYYHELLPPEGAWMEAIASYHQGMYFPEGWNIAQAWMIEKGFVSEEAEGEYGVGIEYTEFSSFDLYTNVPGVIANILLEFVHRSADPEKAEQIVEQAIDSMMEEGGTSIELLKKVSEKINDSDLDTDTKSQYKELYAKVIDIMTNHTADDETIVEVSGIDEGVWDAYSNQQLTADEFNSQKDSVLFELEAGASESFEEFVSYLDDEVTSSWREFSRFLANRETDDYGNAVQFNGLHSVDAIVGRRSVDSKAVVAGYQKAGYQSEDSGEGYLNQSAENDKSIIRPE
jgi:hypothetical protein